MLRISTKRYRALRDTRLVTAGVRNKLPEPPAQLQECPMRKSLPEQTVATLGASFLRLLDAVEIRACKEGDSTP